MWMYKLCNVGEYLDYSICKYRTKLVDRLIEECTENIEETKLDENENENKHRCSSCTMHIFLFSLNFAINIGIGISFAYFYWYLKKDIPRVQFNTRTQATI